MVTGCLWHYLLKYGMGGQEWAGRWAEGAIHASIGWGVMANEISMPVLIESKCSTTCR